MGIIVVRAADLRLPPEREDGPDSFKLADQIQEYGDSTGGMPVIQVTRGARGQYMINDGVTRASRAYWSDPEVFIEVEVIAETDWDFSDLPTVREVVIPR